MKTHQEMMDEFLKTKEIKVIPNYEEHSGEYEFNKSRQTKLERDYKFIAIEKKDKSILENNSKIKLELTSMQRVNDYILGNKEILEKLVKKYRIAKCDYFTTRSGAKVLRYCFNGKRMTEQAVKKHLKM